MNLPGTVNYDAITISRTTQPLTDERYCPRCQYRHEQHAGQRTRWFSVRVEQFQVFTCARCNYEVRDR